MLSHQFVSGHCRRRHIARPLDVGVVLGRTYRPALQSSSRMSANILVGQCISGPHMRECDVRSKYQYKYLSRGCASCNILELYPYSSDWVGASMSSVCFAEIYYTRIELCCASQVMPPNYSLSIIQQVKVQHFIGVQHFYTMAISNHSDNKKHESLLRRPFGIVQSKI